MHQHVAMKKVIQGLLCFVSYAIFHNKIKHHHLSTCAFKPLGRHFDSHLIAKVRQVLYEILIHMYMFVKHDKLLSK